jgi:hypothetical protein
MKKLNVVYYLLFSIFVLFGCKNTNEDVILQNSPSIIKTKALNPDDFNIVGIEHNKALEYVFKQLESRSSKRKTNERNSAEEMLEGGESATIEFIKIYRLPIEEERIAIEQVTEIFSSNIVLDTIKFSYDNGDRTDKHLKYLYKLDSIMSDTDLDTASLISRIKNIEVDALKDELTPQEQFELFSGTSIAKSTIKYWKEHYKEWLALSGKGNKNYRFPDFNWKQMGKEDVACGIEAAGTLGVARFFGTFGWKVWAGGIIGGAVGGSIKDAILQLW